MTPLLEYRLARKKFFREHRWEWHKRLKLLELLAYRKKWLDSQS